MRLVHNTTFLVSNGRDEEFCSLIRARHLPDLRREGRLADSLFTRLRVNEPEGNSYSLQLFFPSADDLDHFTRHRLPRLLDDLHAALGNDILHFSTILEEI